MLSNRALTANNTANRYANISTNQRVFNRQQTLH